METLTRKVGPLPVWAYALIMVGLYLWYRSRSGSATQSDTGAPADTSGLMGSTGESNGLGALGDITQQVRIDVICPPGFTMNTNTGVCEPKGGGGKGCPNCPKGTHPVQWTDKGGKHRCKCVPGGRRR